MPYVPNTFSGEPTPEALRVYVERELLAISREMLETQALDLRPIYAEPLRPRAGMIVYADGAVWNPGAGQGVYTYTLAGAWSKL
jgi:hypothetical protein